MNASKPVKDTLSRAYAVARIVILSAILAYLGWQVYAGRAALAALQPQWDFALVGGALLTAIAAYQCLFAGWLILLRRAGHFQRPALRAYQRIWWISYLYRYVPGKLLLLLERARLGSAAGIPPAAGAALVVMETLLAVLAGSVVSLLAIVYYASGNGGLLIATGCVALFTVVVVPLAFRRFSAMTFVRSRFPELDRVAFGSRDILIAVLPYLLHYLLLGLSFFLLGRCLRLFAWSDLPGLCGVYALSHVISLLMLFAPGGLGVREGALALQLERLMPAGVAGALAIGVRIWFTLVELICYFAVLLLCRGRDAETSSGRGRLS